MRDIPCMQKTNLAILFSIEKLLRYFQGLSSQEQKNTECIKTLGYLYRRIVSAEQSILPAEKLAPFLMILQTKNISATAVLESLRVVEELAVSISEREQILQTLLAISFIPGDKDTDETTVLQLFRAIRKALPTRTEHATDIASLFVSVLTQKRFSSRLVAVVFVEMKEALSVLAEAHRKELISFFMLLVQDKNTQKIEIGIDCLFVLWAPSVAEQMKQRLIPVLTILLTENKEAVSVRCLELLFCISSDGAACEAGHLVSVLNLLISTDYAEIAVFTLYRLFKREKMFGSVLFLCCFSEYGDIAQILASALRDGLNRVSGMAAELLFEIVAILLNTTQMIRIPNGCCLHAIAQHKKEAIVLLNKSISDGVEYLQMSGFFEDSVFSSVGEALHSLIGLDKTRLSKFLCKRQHRSTLLDFMRQLDFKSKRIDEALRVVAAAINIPREAQEIERVIECFSEVYFDSVDRRLIESLDATICLSFSIMMLNTDQHNKNVKKRMELCDYIRNVRGLNNKNDFAPELLQEIFSSIREDAFSYEWEDDGLFSLWKKAEQNIWALQGRRFSKCTCPANFPETFLRSFACLVSQNIDSFLFRFLERSNVHTPAFDQILDVLLVSTDEKTACSHAHLLIKALQDKRKDRQAKNAVFGRLLALASRFGSLYTSDWEQIISLAIEGCLEDEVRAEKVSLFFRRTESFADESALGLFLVLCRRVSARNARREEEHFVGWLFDFCDSNAGRLQMFWNELFSISARTNLHALFCNRLVALAQNIHAANTAEILSLALQMAKKMPWPAIKKIVLCAKHASPMTRTETIDRCIALAREAGNPALVEELLTSLAGTELTRRQEDEFLLLSDGIVFSEDASTDNILTTTLAIVEKRKETLLSVISVFAEAVAGNIRHAKLLHTLLLRASLKAEIEAAFDSLLKASLLPMLNKLGRKGRQEPALLIPLLETFFSFFERGLPIHQPQNFDLFLSLCFSAAFFHHSGCTEIVEPLRRFVLAVYRHERTNKTRWIGLWREIDFAVPGISRECEAQTNSLLLSTDL
eukprot:GHVN01101310.1.p1 GENE.GHVN01101310.1~~GHVN01101310.1.p1  ORF type:complete len:1042 (+),score=84.91 GHVN01101310.1:1068-4193(+)